MIQLKEDYSIIIVTHNMQQAARVSDKTAFFNVALDTKGSAPGIWSSSQSDRSALHAPKEKATEDYITGRFG